VTPLPDGRLAARTAASVLASTVAPRSSRTRTSSVRSTIVA
jgi:hypothetical protein